MKASLGAYYEGHNDERKVSFSKHYEGHNDERKVSFNEFDCPCLS